MRPTPLPIVCLLATAFALVLTTSPAQAMSYAWDDSACSGGGSWYQTTCWGGSNYPNGIDDTAYLTLQNQGAVTIPTSYLFNVKLNSLQVTKKVSLSLQDNMVLLMSEASTGTDPTMLLQNVLSIDSGAGGGSSLRAASSLDPDGSTDLLIVGDGEIHLGNSAFLESAPRASIEIDGEVAITTSGSESQPSTINADLLNNAGDISVLSGTLVVNGRVENAANTSLVLFDQYLSGLSEVRLLGTLTGGRLLPGMGTVRVNGGTLADIEIGAGPLEVTGSCLFTGEVILDAGSQVTVMPGKILDIGSTAEFAAPHVINKGEIVLGDPISGGGNLRVDGSLVELDGNGSVVMNSLGAMLSSSSTGAIRNGPQHTIEGFGYINCPVQNQGWIIVHGGSMVVFASVTGPEGSIVVGGNSTTPGLLDVRAGISTKLLRITPYGKLYVGPVLSPSVKGSWVVETQDESAITWSGGTQLVMDGGGPIQGFETTSEDLGAVNAGFSGNFEFQRLLVGLSGTNVLLRDLADNGNRGSGPEAVYTLGLEVQPGATLNLNGYHLYTMYGGVPYQVHAGDGSLFGGGTIIDDGSVVTANDPIPSTTDLSALRVAPNPFNPRTTIRFRLERAGEVSVSVFDLRGRHLRTLTSREWPAGAHELIWDGHDDAGQRLASGVYVVRVIAGGVPSVRRVTLLK
jgi:hypothetical protein